MSPSGRLLAVLVGLATPLFILGINVTVEQGAGPLYSGRDLPFFLEPLPGENVSSADGGAARGWLQVPNRSNSTGGVCARARDNPPLAAMVACRALGWRGVARAGGAPPPADATAVGDSGVALSALACDGTEPGVLACNLTRVEANFTGCAPRARLVIECAQDPGEPGELRFRPAPPAASAVDELYGRGRVVEAFANGFWGYPAGQFGPRVAVVLCREAGFEGGTAAVGNPLSGAGLGYRPAGAAPALAGMRCNGTEEALAECVYRTVPPLPPTPYFDYVQREGSLSLFTGPSLPLLLCPDAFNESDAAAETSGDGDFPVRLFSLRPADDGDGCVSGQAQIRVDGFWGGIALGGGEAEAQELARSGGEVICRQLGAPTGNVTAAAVAEAADVYMPVWVSDLECSGEEESVLECGYASDVMPGASLAPPPGPPLALQVSCCPA